MNDIYKDCVGLVGYMNIHLGLKIDFLYILCRVSVRL